MGLIHWMKFFVITALTLDSRVLRLEMLLKMSNVWLKNHRDYVSANAVHTVLAYFDSIRCRDGRPRLHACIDRVRRKRKCESIWNSLGAMFNVGHRGDKSQFGRYRLVYKMIPETTPCIPLGLLLTDDCYKHGMKM